MTARPTPAAVLEAAQSEAQWQKTVTDYATLKGWLVYHTYDSRRSQAGFPDLVLVRDGRLILAELKRVNGRVRSEQAVWLKALDKVWGIEVYLWKPQDWRLVQETLE